MSEDKSRLLDFALEESLPYCRHRVALGIKSKNKSSRGAKVGVVLRMRIFAGLISQFMIKCKWFSNLN